MKLSFTVRKRSCGKVMFLHLSVILSTGGGVCPSACWDTPHGQTPPWADTPWANTPRADTPWANTPQQMATAADGMHPTGMYSCL